MSRGESELDGVETLTTGDSGFHKQDEGLAGGTGVHLVVTQLRNGAGNTTSGTCRFDAHLVVFHFPIITLAGKTKLSGAAEPEPGIGGTGHRVARNGEAQIVRPLAQILIGEDLLTGIFPVAVGVEINPGAQLADPGSGHRHRGVPTWIQRGSKHYTIFVITVSIGVVPDGVRVRLSVVFRIDGSAEEEISHYVAGAFIGIERRIGRIGGVTEVELPATAVVGLAGSGGLLFVTGGGVVRQDAVIHQAYRFVAGIGSGQCRCVVRENPVVVVAEGYRGGHLLAALVGITVKHGDLAPCQHRDGDLLSEYTADDQVFVVVPTGVVAADKDQAGIHDVERFAAAVADTHDPAGYIDSNITYVFKLYVGAAVVNRTAAWLVVELRAGGIVPVGLRIEDHLVDNHHGRRAAAATIVDTKMLLIGSLSPGERHLVETVRRLG